LPVSQEVRNRVANSFPPAHVFRARRVMKILQKSTNYGDEIITNAIQSGKPILIGRLGGTEARVLGCYLDIFKFSSIYDPISTLYSVLNLRRRLTQLNSGAGVYPINRSVVQSFVREQLEALLKIDILGTWGSTFTWVEKYALKKPGVLSVSHHSVAPWIEVYPSNSLSAKPWSYSLDAKKILVISGFSESFQKQHERIDRVFPKVRYPSFSAKFINCPISTGGLSDGKTWVNHLERIKDEMESVDFDIALISAGAYALPLAYHAKKLGKVGITCGGELQLFFGVVGKRWEKMKKVTKYRNEYWIRPSDAERPPNWREIENGCYW